MERLHGHGVEPGARRAAAPTGVDKADRHAFAVGAQLLGHEVAGGREWLDRGGRGGGPGQRLGEFGLRHRRGRLLDHRQADAVVGGGAHLVPGVERARDRGFHVRLARAQPDVADQDIAPARRAGCVGEHEGHARLARLARREGQREAPPGVGGCSGLGGAQRSCHPRTGARGARDQDRLPALEHHMLAVACRELRGGGGGGRQHPRRERERPHPSLARVCAKPFTGAS